MMPNIEKICKRMASCLESVRRRVGSYKEHKEDLQRKATAADFACIEHYLRHENAKDLEKCKIVYKLYNECLGKKEMKGFCKYYCNNCPQFK